MNARYAMIVRIQAFPEYFVVDQDVASCTRQHYVQAFFHSAVITSFTNYDFAVEGSGREWISRARVFIATGDRIGRIADSAQGIPEIACINNFHGTDAIGRTAERLKPLTDNIFRRRTVTASEIFQDGARQTGMSSRRHAQQPGRQRGIGGRLRGRTAVAG